jgi:hypothetical protein
MDRAGRERVLWTREQTHGQLERRDASSSGGSGGWRGATSRSATPPQPQEHHGPRAYRRSDARITEDIYERLVGAEEIDSRDVTVGVQQGKVTLHGTVPERQMKHRIEDLAAACHGVEDIDNFVRVRRRHEPWWSPATAPAVAPDEARGRGDTGSAAGSGDAASTPMRAGATVNEERGRHPSRADSSAAAGRASIAGADTHDTNRSAEALTRGEGGRGTSNDVPRDGHAGGSVTGGRS